MPFNGSGVYTAPAADFPVVTQTVISSTHFNNTINDIATALSTCLTKDGQQTATANIPFGGFRATNVGITAIAGSVGTPAINVSDAATGLYRSAASELAVTVAGVQVARFASTGLIVTGAASISTTLTATTSVVAPILDSGAGSLVLKGAGTTALTVTGANLVAAGTLTVNGVSANIASVTPTLFLTDPVFGAAGLQSGVNSGGTGAGNFLMFNVPAGKGFTFAVNNVSKASIDSSGNLTLVGGDVGTAAATDLTASTSGGVQAGFLHTAGVTRHVTITGSNGGNPTISTTAGSLAITPAVVIAGASLSVGTSPASAGAVNLPFNGHVSSRNLAGSADVCLAVCTTVNSVNNIVSVGIGSFGTQVSNGVLLVGRSGAGAPTTSDIPAGEWALWRDTSGATTKLYYNNAGAIQSVALA